MSEREKRNPCPHCGETDYCQGGWDCGTPYSLVYQGHRCSLSQQLSACHEFLRKLVAYTDNCPNGHRGALGVFADDARKLLGEQKP